jgi:plasmid replication initiation protein
MEQNILFSAATLTLQRPQTQQQKLQKLDKWLQFQPNSMTNARYHYSATAKNILYEILDLLQKYQTREKMPNFDLFGNIVITLDVGKVVKSKNYKDAWIAIEEELMTRPMRYSYKKEGKLVDVSTVLIPSMERVRGSAQITFKLVAEAIPALLYLGQGFTAYSKTIALTLPSVYSKRIYEFCCGFRDTGYFVVTVNEFRKELCCEDKFKQFGELRKKVIEQAVRDINNDAYNSDIHISYRLLRGNNVGRGNGIVERILFFIEETKKDGKFYEREFSTVYNLLADAGYTNAMNIADWFLGEKCIVVVSQRFSEIREDLKNGVVRQAGLHNYLLPILAGFGLPADLAPKVAPKKKKEKS